MIHASEKHERRSIRLKDYDYSEAGVYFVTICTHKKECVFGDIVNGKVVLNEYGRVVQEEWDQSAVIRREVELDAFVVMPNHIHGIVVIVESNVGATGRSPLPKGPTPKSVGAMLAGFKSAVTRRINDSRETPYASVWQRNYYEHVIRDEDDLSEIREYIVNNPLKWDLDSENLQNVGATGRSPLRK